MRRTRLLVALALAALQVAVGATYLVLSFFVGEIWGEGTVTDFRLPAYGVAIVATGMAGACLAAAALLCGQRYPWLATAGLLAGACLLLEGGVAQAQTLPPEATPPGPSPCTGSVEATPGGPTAPTNLSARWGPLPDVPESSGVLLAWQDNAEDEGCQAVQRKGPGGEQWEGRIFLSAGDDFADDRVFEALGQYCYRVLAANERGASVSNETCVQVPEVTVREGLPPGAPPPSYPTLAPGIGPSPGVPAALPDTGAGSGSMAGSTLPLWLAGLAAAAAFATAVAATWQIAAARRRR